jgi:cyclic pyranopterin phosphate synthase
VRPLVDGHGRPIGDVRISVTDRCNFRCQYCMPAEGLPWLDRSALLTYEEIERIVRLLAAMGVHDVRLTGGEPLVRKELWRLVERLSAIEDVHDLSLTTNGYLLAKQVEDLVRAGLRRVNVSLDSLAPDRFFQLTRRDSLHQVLEGLEAAQRHSRTSPRTRCCGSPSSRAGTRTRCASSSSCRSTPTAPGRARRCCPTPRSWR